MGVCCCKEECPNDNDCDAIPTEDIIAPFAVVQSKSEIMPNPNTIFIGVYPVDNYLVYVYSLPKQNPQPNKFLINQNIVEVLCESFTVDIPMIMKQVRYLARNMQY